MMPGQRFSNIRQSSHVVKYANPRLSCIIQGKKVVCAELKRDYVIACMSATGFSAPEVPNVGRPFMSGINATSWAYIDSSSPSAPRCVCVHIVRCETVLLPEADSMSALLLRYIYLLPPSCSRSRSSITVTPEICRLREDVRPRSMDSLPRIRKPRLLMVRPSLPVYLETTYQDRTGARSLEWSGNVQISLELFL